MRSNHDAVGRSLVSSVPGWVSAATRSLFSALLLFLSIYCLLAYLPDTYYMLIRAPYLAWLPWLIRLQPWIFSGLSLALCAVLFLEGKQHVRRLLIEFALVLLAAAIFFFATEPLAHLQNDSRSFLWSLVLLFPVFFLGTLDIAADWELIENSNRQPPRRLGFAVPLIVAGVVGIVDPGTSILRSLQTSSAFHLVAPDMWAWLTAIAADLLFCVFLVSLYNLPESLDCSQRPVLRFVLYRLLTWFLLDRLLQNVILDSLPFHSIPSQVYSGTLSFTLVIFGESQQRLFQKITSWRNGFVEQKKTRLPLALAIVFVALSYLVPSLIGLLDWNSLLNKMWTLMLWAGAITAALLWRRMRSPRPYPALPIVCILVCSPLLYVYALAPSSHRTEASDGSRTMDAAFDQHLSLDTSYRVVEEMWAWRRTSWPWRRKNTCDDLCQYLLTQSNLPRTAKATAVDVKLVEKLGPTSARKPNIFVVVIDSLRQDYISAYNPAVTFTPEIGKFAAESTVFRNAFTRYNGTALSEPAIWAGAMLLHKKSYLQPFHNINGMEKLLDTDDYQRFISVDIPVLQVVLQRPPDLVPLDENVKIWTQEDFCSTENDAENKIARRSSPSRPIFMYAQPQNLHAITLAELRPDRNPKKPYPGFMPKAASELERLDGCFGRFIRYLKSSGLYNNSIVVLTSDHGDSYGEFGRQGHAWTMNPEVLRIPLIIHLPDKMNRAHYHDPNQIAFNLDITPTLYYLLGHGPIVNDPRFGRPLFTRTSEEAETYRRDTYLVVNTYTPTYGLLSANGKRLFIANPLDATNGYFDLEKDPDGVVDLLNAQILLTNQKVMHDHVQQIGNLYHLEIHEPTFMEWLMH